MISANGRTTQRFRCHRHFPRRESIPLVSKPIIEVREVSKRYRLGEFGARSLREEAELAWKRLWRKNGASAGSNGKDDPAHRNRSPEEFWALSDVSFTVQPGEVVGIIGRNGAGKSTLLKILSRITKPTTGEIIMRGRVASLLEVGTGFHPELSGRENIYLNGAILGMRHSEIARKLDEIVDFAEVHQFIDTPVKRYSSGMYVRLAFAVAAHLEPEILVIDEVLAVGDQQFQDKCIGKMREVASSHGRTVLFVSHNLGAISSLTNHCAYLKSGRLEGIGGTAAIVDSYTADSAKGGSTWTASTSTSHPLQIISVTVHDAGGMEAQEMEVSESFTVQLEYVVRQPFRQGLVEFYFIAADGTHVATFGEHDLSPGCYSLREPGRYRCSVAIPPDLLGLGRYTIRVNSGRGSQETFDHEDAVAFHVVETRTRSPRENRRGHLQPMLSWNTTRIPELTQS
jgi:lipopolysaccharide transport system ATP-binding protein